MFRTAVCQLFLFNKRIIICDASWDCADPKIILVGNRALTGTTKTLMYFDGCDIHLGCTVTLRGGALGELRRVGLDFKISLNMTLNCIVFGEL